MAVDLSIRAVVEGFNQAKSGLNDLSRGLDQVAEKHSGLAQTASRSGVSTEELAAAIKKLGVSGQGLSELDAAIKKPVEELKQLSGATVESKNALDDFSRFIPSLSTVLMAGLAFGIGFVVTHLKEAISHVINFGEELSRLSQRTGISATSLGELSLAAQISNISMNELAIGVQQFSKNIIATDKDVDAASGAFQRLGIRVRDSNGVLKSNEQLLGEVANRFAATADGAAKTEIAMALFSRAGASLIPLLNQGASGLDDLREAARQAGIVLSEDTVKAADDFNKNMAILSANAQGFWVQIASPIVEGMASITTAMVNARKEGGGFWASVASGMGKILEAELIGLAKMAVAGADTLGVAESIVARFREFIAERDKLLAGGTAPDKPALPGRTDFKKLLEEERKALLENLRLEHEEVQRAVRKQQELLRELVQQEIQDINLTAFITREQKIAALEALLIKYQELEQTAPAAYKAIADELKKAAADTRTFAQELSQALGREQTLQTALVNTVVELRRTTSHELAEMLRGHQNFREAVSNIWQSMKVRLLDRMAEVAVDAGIRAIATSAAWEAAAAASTAAWMAFAAAAEGAFAAVQAAGVGATGPIGVAFLAMIDIIRNPFENLVTFMTTGMIGFGEIIKKLFGEDFIRDLVENVGDAFRAVGQFILDFFRAIADEIRDVILSSIPGVGGILGGGGTGGIGHNVIGGIIGGGVIGGIIGGLFQHGGEQIVTRPTLFAAGEMGAERVSVTPLSFGEGSIQRGPNMIFNGPVMLDNYTWKLWQRRLLGGR